jgi:hypothetical protein
MNKYLATTQARAGEKYSPSLIESRLNQSLMSVRCITVDDGSNTLEPPDRADGALTLSGYSQDYWKTKRIRSPEVVRLVRGQQIHRLFWMESQWR